MLVGSSSGLNEVSGVYKSDLYDGNKERNIMHCESPFETLGLKPKHPCSSSLFFI
jgi:hypothetical protein